MMDMSSTIIAKSDQINAADLVGITKTITITEVKIKPGEDQPVSVYFEGDQKVFRPCKGVRRLMVRVWGPDASKYVGQSMTLFQDPTVTWAGKPEGGIRVSHMTGLSSAIVEPMRTSRAATKPYKIEPLASAKPSGDVAVKWAEQFIAAVERAPDAAKLDEFVAKKASGLTDAQENAPGLYERCMSVVERKRAEFGAPATDTAGEGWTDDAPATDEWGADDAPATTDDAPVWKAKVDQLLQDIAEASGKASWEEANAAFKAIDDGLPDEVSGELRLALETRKGELMKAG